MFSIVRRRWNRGSVIISSLLWNSNNEFERCSCFREWELKTLNSNSSLSSGGGGIGIGFGFGCVGWFHLQQQQQRQRWSGSRWDDGYEHIKANVNCPRCSNHMSLIFSNRPLSISGREPGIFQALNLCPSCKTAFYFKPHKLHPLNGTFIEIGRVINHSPPPPQPPQPPQSSSSSSLGGFLGDTDTDTDTDTNPNPNPVKMKMKMKMKKKKKNDFPTPKQIFNALNHFVVGQENAKKVLSVAVYNHYNRIRLAASSTNQTQTDQTDLIEPDKSNVMLIGPTGSGKTLLAKTLARIVNVPFTIADATTLTQAGYVGEDVESILYNLLVEADFNVELAQQGIVYVDEVDKITKKGESLNIGRDVSGEGVQQALLRMLESTVVSVPDKGDGKHHAGDSVLIDTKNILFICGGAFVNLEKTISERQQDSSIGFGVPVRANMRTCGFTDAVVTSSLLENVESGDLIAYGLIPEFVGRFPILAGLSALNEDQLFQILVEPKNALVKQYKKMFRMNNVSLHFTDNALKLIAKKAMAKNTGARGLRALLENILTEVMFEIPDKAGNDNIKAVLVDEEAVGSVNGPGLGAKIVYRDDEGALEGEAMFVNSK